MMPTIGYNEGFPLLFLVAITQVTLVDMQTSWSMCVSVHKTHGLYKKTVLRRYVSSYGAMTLICGSLHRSLALLHFSRFLNYYSKDWHCLYRFGQLNMNAPQKISLLNYAWIIYCYRCLFQSSKYLLLSSYCWRLYIKKIRFSKMIFMYSPQYL